MSVQSIEDLVFVFYSPCAAGSGAFLYVCRIMHTHVNLCCSSNWKWQDAKEVLKFCQTQACWATCHCYDTLLFPSADHISHSLHHKHWRTFFARLFPSQQPRWLGLALQCRSMCRANVPTWWLLLELPGSSFPSDESLRRLLSKTNTIKVLLASSDSAALFS